jgi:hypothetical protein
MAIDVYASLDLHHNQMLEMALENEPSNPATPVPGQIYFNTTSNTPFVWNGSAWVSLFQATSKFATTIGDGVTLVFPVTHNLGTLDTVESVYDVTTGLEEIAVIQHTSANVTTFTFTVPPALNSVRVVIHG